MQTILLLFLTSLSLFSFESVQAQTLPPSDQVLELIEDFVQENYAYGDDGIDCLTEVQDLKLLQADKSPLKPTANFLYEFRTGQEVERHGCGITLKCHALVGLQQSTKKLKLIWAHCKI